MKILTNKNIYIILHRNWRTTRRCPMDHKLIIRVRLSVFLCYTVRCVYPKYLMMKILALERDGFDGQPLYFCNVATCNEKVIGYTLSYYTYSTWCGKAMYLEDIYVTPDFRGKHVGIKLLKTVAKVYSVVGLCICVCAWLWNICRKQFRTTVTNWTLWFSTGTQRKNFIKCMEPTMWQLRKSGTVIVSMNKNWKN
jgi:GNAT superfamily N-acetyltransferase